MNKIKIVFNDATDAKIARELITNFVNEDSKLLEAVKLAVKTGEMKEVLEHSLRLKNDIQDHLNFVKRYNELKTDETSIKKILGIPITREGYHEMLNKLFREGKLAKEQRSKLFGISSINWEKSYNEFLTLNIA